MNSANLVSVFLSMVALWSIEAAPTTKKPQNGPCVGMDCLHGILMHGDGDPGEDHKTQDEYTRLQGLDAVKGKISGPCHGDGCLNTVGVRDAAKIPTQSKDRQRLGPEKREPDGPCVGMDCLHGVLMHGDDVMGLGHKQEDEQIRINADQTGNKLPAIVDPEEALHGGGEVHKRHSPIPDKIRKQIGNDDGLSSDVDPEALLHWLGDNHVHLPRELDLDEGGDRESTAVDPEVLLHGTGGHDHDGDEIKKGKDESEGHRSMTGVLDPHGILRGEFDIGISKSRREELRKIEERKRRDLLEKEKESSGFSLRFIYDGVQDEIQELQRRYLPKFWGFSGSIYEETKEQYVDTQKGAIKTREASSTILSGDESEGIIQDMGQEVIEIHENINETKKKKVPTATLR